MGYRFFKVVLVVTFMLEAMVFEVKCIAAEKQLVETTVQDTNAYFRERVVACVRWQMDNYPESRLIDLYKNFFQDKFGPGHMIADTASAGAYLRRELATVSGRSQKEYVETTGWQGNFVRVDLAVINDGKMDYADFFKAFIQSAAQTVAPSAEDWIKEWKEIEVIIKQLYPQIPGLIDDSRTLDELLKKGEFVVHHSEEYNKKYNPHYRLIRRTAITFALPTQ